MKVKEILSEAPYHLRGDMERGFTTLSYTSDSSLGRLYEQIEEVAIGGEVVRLFSLKTTKKTIGVVRRKKPDTKEDSNAIVFSLRFKQINSLMKTPADIGSKRVLQVDKVATHQDFEGEGMASFVYATLARLGNVVVSDTSQFTDGKMLWKKMSREAKVKDYNVYILDDEYGFRKNEEGDLVCYDSKNIDDAELWTTGLDFSGEHILFVMVAK